MNEFLAEMYGTRENIGAPSDDSDVQKLAEAQLLDEALQAEGIDIDKLPGETIVKLAHQILGEDSHIVKEAMAQGGSEEEHLKQAAMQELQAQEGEEPFEEKVAQADFLGRVMAHSYVDEMAALDKEAGVKEMYEGAKAGLGRAGSWIGSKAKGGYGAAKEKTRAGYEATKRGLGQAGEKTKEYAGKAREKGQAAARATGEHVKRHGKKYSAGAGAAGGLTAGYALGKYSSALDTLAEKRAMEWAEEHGLLNDNEEAKLAAAVDRRAYQMLREQGIDVDAIEANA